MNNVLIVFATRPEAIKMAPVIKAFKSSDDFATKLRHVEAGLRTFNKYALFPKEINRSITGKIANFHFVPLTYARG